MISKQVIAAIIFFSLYSCSGQSTKESEELIKAKWYFYSYASTLTGYINGSKPINPLECDINLYSLNQEGDTIKFFFKAFYKDTTNECSFKPNGLAGVMIIKDKVYLPIYHSIVFDAFESEGATLDYMDRQEKELRDAIERDKKNIVPWLYKEAKRRGLIQ